MCKFRAWENETKETETERATTMKALFSSSPSGTALGFKVRYGFAWSSVTHRYFEIPREQTVGVL